MIMIKGEHYLTMDYFDNLNNELLNKYLKILNRKKL
jgi:hypothetical protein